MFGKKKEPIFNVENTDTYGTRLVLLDAITQLLDVVEVVNLGGWQSAFFLMGLTSGTPKSVSRPLSLDWSRLSASTTPPATATMKPLKKNGINCRTPGTLSDWKPLSVSKSQLNISIRGVDKSPRV